MLEKHLFNLFVLMIIGLPINAQEFVIDKGHTFVRFAVNRFATVDVHGRFNDFSGNVTYDTEKNMITAAEFSLNVESIDTGHDIRDGHLKGEIWLDAAHYPSISFTASDIQKTDDGYLAKGELTIKGKTNLIELPFVLSGPFVDPTKQTTIGISTNIIIDRQEYGLSFSRLMDNGQLFIGNEVEIWIDALFQTN